MLNPQSPPPARPATAAGAAALVAKPGTAPATKPLSAASSSSKDAPARRTPLAHHALGTGAVHTTHTQHPPPQQQQQQRICKGRVANLESNVPPAWWSHVFDHVYLKTDGDVVEDPEITRSEVDMLESYPYLAAVFKRGSASAAASSPTPPRVLDLCCGQGRHALELARRYPRLEIYGYDQSAFLIDLARQRARDQGVADRCRFAVGDCRHLPFPADAFDLVLIMGNSFGYFTSSASDLLVLRECHRVSKPHAYLVLDLTDGHYQKHHFSPRTWEWIDDDTFVCRERQLAKDGKSLVSREVVTDVTKGVVRDQFYAERLYELDEVEMLMEMALYTPAREMHARTSTAGSAGSAGPAAGASLVAAPTSPVPHLLVRSPSTQTGRGLSKSSSAASLASAGATAAGLVTTAASAGGETLVAAKELSKRQEDLGMMGQRMVVIACKEPSSSSSSAAVPTHRDDAALFAALFHSTTPIPDTASEAEGSTYAGSSEYDHREHEHDHDRRHEHSYTDDVDLHRATPVSSTADGTVADSAYCASVAASVASLATRSGATTSTATTSTPIEALASPVPVPRIGQVVVILGDPSIGCVGKLHDTWNPEDLATRQKLVEVLDAAGAWSVADGTLRIVDSHADLIGELAALARTRGRLAHSPNTNGNVEKEDEMDVVVFNLCDEGYWNDALKELHVPALLEMLQLPYTGATPQSLGLCYDKALVNSQARAMGIPTPREAYYLGSLAVADPATADADLDRLVAAAMSGAGPGAQFPAFVKPMRGDNSLGITARSVVHNGAELHAYVRELHGMGLGDVVIQEYLTGPEFSVGVIGNPRSGFRFLPILQVDYSAIVARNLVPILGFESKWDPASPYWTEIRYVAATGLAPRVVELLQARCAALFERFGCRDYARFDFRADGGFAVDGAAAQEDADAAAGRIKLLEVNPNPGWCWDGKLAHMAKLQGLEYRDLVLLILEAGVRRMAAEKRASA
ncbi:hypothetical protein H9P43_007476 [Blastocladiella emersonii ATCC 22665]|nr:hypothetical protein H9P43_007476 [Blastocladiella emersonii ATCC 22665]